MPHGCARIALRGGTAAAADGAAAAVKEAQPHARRHGHLAQAARAAVQAPLRGGDAAELVGVGVAEHDLLRAAAQPQQFAVARFAQQLGEGGVRLPDRIGGLEQRHEADGGVSGRQVHQADFARQYHRGQHVVGAQGLGDDVAFDGARAEPVQGGAHRLHGGQRHAGLVGQPGGRSADGPPAGQFGGERLEPLVRRQSRVIGSVGQAAIQRGQRRMVLLGVLADVERRQVEAEPRHPAQQAAHRPVCDHRAAVGAQGALQQFQLRHQFAGGQVVVARHMARVLGDAPARVLQPAAHERQLEPVALAGVAAPRLAVGGRQRGAVAAQAVAKLLRHAVDVLGAAELRGQFVDRAQKFLQRAVVLQFQHRGRHLGGDQRVAVAVAADPAPEVQRAGVGRQLDADPLELRVQLVEQVAAHPAQQLLQVVDRRPRLVDGGGAVHTQLVGLPDQVDRLG